VAITINFYAFYDVAQYSMCQKGVFQIVTHKNIREHLDTENVNRKCHPFATSERIRTINKLYNLVERLIKFIRVLYV